MTTEGIILQILMEVDEEISRSFIVAFSLTQALFKPAKCRGFLVDAQLNYSCEN